MSQIIQTEVFTFAELSDEAKEKAREWYREGAFDYDWYDCTYADAKQCAKILGIEIDNIYFSGFWSQGDGACFEGRYSYQRGAAHAIKKHAPEDSTLHSIADDLQAIQKKHAYNLTATVKQSGRYSHEYATEIDVFEHGDHTADEASKEVADQLRRFMHWIYRQLETEYEYLNSDEHVDESIKINEYTFTESGKRFG